MVYQVYCLINIKYISYLASVYKIKSFYRHLILPDFVVIFKLLFNFRNIDGVTVFRN